MMLDQVALGFLGLTLFLVAVGLGMPIAFAALLTGLGGMWAMVGWGTALATIGTSVYGQAADYSLSVIPLFVLMGYASFEAGFAQEMYSGARAWLGHLRGGLVLATIATGTGIAAITGSGVASATLMVKMALPEMEKLGYNQRFASGCIVDVGTLAVVIPPSTLIVTYGILTETSIAKLLLACIAPGLVLAGLYTLNAVVRTRINPSLAPAAPAATWKERWHSIGKLWHVAMIIGLMIGGLYTGIFTATEAGAVGSGGVILLGLASRRLNARNIWRSFMDTGRVSAMLLFLIASILVFSQFIAITRVTNALVEWINSLGMSTMGFMVSAVVLYIFLGCLLSTTAMLVLTLPVIYPVVQAMGIDPIWFGVIIVLLGELGSATPPVGFTLYAVHAAAPHIPLNDISLGVLPWCISDILAITIILIFPQLTSLY